MSSLLQTLNRYGRDPLSLGLATGVMLSAGFTLLVLLFILSFILVQGIPHLQPSLFAWEYTTENVSMLPAIMDTLIMILIALALAAPLGIGAAIYLVEYASKDNKLVKWMRLASDTLAGIPSIIYGLFGMLFFVSYLHLGYSLLSGACTLAIMILPVLLRTAEEALRAVPQSYREGCYGLGAGKLRTVFGVVFPAAVPGVLAGVILSIGRIVGETAALMYTSGTVAAMPEGLLSSGRTLAVHMYVLSSEGLYMQQAFGTAVVLMLLVIGINLLSEFVAGKIRRG